MVNKFLSICLLGILCLLFDSQLRKWVQTITSLEGQKNGNSMSESLQIIYINGPSSSGKTTLAKALQQKFDQPFYTLESTKSLL
ncbi:MAG: hypothetical protein H0W50_10610 [Parachlamydiaceae bacterium]|nr:hypothetical protein [Parachlamydiaceae bacterium]